MKNEVVLSGAARASYLAIKGEKELAAIDATFDLLVDFPDLGHVYVPLFEEAKPKGEVRVVQAGRHSIYYRHNSARGWIEVLILVSQRQHIFRFCLSNGE